MWSALLNAALAPGGGASMLGMNELLRLSVLLPHLPCRFCSVPQVIDSNATSMIDSLSAFPCPPVSGAVRAEANLERAEMRRSSLSQILSLLLPVEG